MSPKKHFMIVEKCCVVAMQYRVRKFIQKWLSNNTVQTAQGAQTMDTSVLKENSSKSSFVICVAQNCEYRQILAI